MKAIVIGSGLAGLTAALRLAQAGWQVEVLEQGAQPGGVTAGIRAQGFYWDLGQLNVEGFGADEPVGEVYQAMGVLERIKLVPENREYVFPDFAVRIPAVYGGARWRIDELKRLFPEDAAGLERYWKDYLRFTRLVTLARRAEKAGGAGKLWAQAKMFLALLPLFSKKDWSAERIMAHYFKSEKLRAVFVSILADFFTPPSQFPGLGVFAVNPETAYEKRMPSKLARDAEMPRLYSIRGGTRAIVDALVAALAECGGVVRTGCAVTRILVEEGRTVGVEDAGGQRHSADAVIASGGAKETLIQLVGEAHLPPGFGDQVRGIPLMDSIFMLHLGVDMNPGEYLHATSTYVYGTYDVESGIARARAGLYHEGADGFVIHFPTLASPEYAPPGRHALTVYTIAPDKLASGSWNELKEHYAERLLDCTEKVLPGIREHIVTARVLSPDDFRAITHLSHHAFGGIAPVLNAWRVPHQTPVTGLWFIGAQSESGGGVNNVILGAYKAAGKILNCELRNAN